MFLMWNLQHIIFIGRWRYWQIFKIVCLYVCVCAHFVCIKALLVSVCFLYISVAIYLLVWHCYLIWAAWVVSNIFFSNPDILYTTIWEKPLTNQLRLIYIVYLCFICQQLATGCVYLFIRIKHDWLVDWIAR